MTMLDDDRLVSLLTSAGSAFEVPASGPDDILDLAQGPAVIDEAVSDGASPASADLSRATRRLVAVALRHRAWSVAACVVVVLLAAGTIGVAVSGPPARPRLSATAPRSGHPGPSHVPVSATTVPGLQNAGGTAARNGVRAAPFSSASPDAAGTTPSTPSGAAAVPKGVVGRPARIEQTATLGLTVGRGDLRQAMTQLMNLAGAYGGFVASSQTQSGTNSLSPASSTVTLQVPADNFATVLKAAQGMGKTSSLTTKATDVTGHYVDLQSRVTALQASRQQYLTIMAKATTVGDVLAVQSQLDTIQSQIDQLQGQLNTLGSETSYATVTTNLNEATPPARPNPVPEPGFIGAWHDSIGGFVAGVDGLVRVAGPVLFAILCLGVALAGGRALWRRIQRQRL